MAGSDDPDKTTVLNAERTLTAELEQAKGAEACLILIRGTPQGHRFFLEQDEMVLGRDPGVELTVNDPSISRQHAKVIKKGEEVVLQDLNSSNGTVVNGEKLAPGQSIVLKKEDMIKLGNAILKFLPKGELEILTYGALSSAAHTDPLTKTYNKRYLLEALDAEFKRAVALGQNLSLMFFDIDHFKKTNDTFGHEAGDLVLKEFSSLIKTHVPERNVFARYGGEEFVIFSPGEDKQQAALLAEKIRAGIESKTFVYEGKKIPTTTSIGVSDMQSSGAKDPAALIKAADEALYKAKESGRNRVVIG
jgi:two-component system cell cycle response regulator